mmetsp:Transcript_5814/g.22071  ORF Transcript_5814/g.22071 Transcript_5814/m.22071 type:complete len:124 (+) Transcript_5814:1593-1964(+)
MRKCLLKGTTPQIFVTFQIADPFQDTPTTTKEKIETAAIIIHLKQYKPPPKRRKKNTTPGSKKKKQMIRNLIGGAKSHHRVVAGRQADRQTEMQREPSSNHRILIKSKQPHSHPLVNKMRHDK